MVLFGVLALMGGVEGIQAQSSCPSNTTVQEHQATLVGEVTDDGGDPDLWVWFKYGTSSNNLNYEVLGSSQYGTGTFCKTITGLYSCTTYYYQAFSRNSAGTSSGEIKSFKTVCPAVTVDLKVNNSDSTINLNYKDKVTVSWTSENATTCSASGDWSGMKSTSGSEQITLDNSKTYNFEITCTASDGRSASDTGKVIVSVYPPVVITKPAVVTY
jgi:hypothetical protein